MLFDIPALKNPAKPESPSPTQRPHTLAPLKVQQFVAVHLDLLSVSYTELQSDVESRAESY
jgi:hypothetical protein